MLLLLAACHAPDPGSAREEPRDPAPDTAPEPDPDRGEALPTACDPRARPRPGPLTRLAQVRDEGNTAGHLDIVDLVSAGGLLYGAGLGGLIPISVRDPAAPTVLFHDPTVKNRYTHVEALRDAMGAAVHPDRGLDVYDLSNPSVPVLLSSVEATGWDGLAYVGTDLYVGVRGEGLVVVDLADPTLPAVGAPLPGLDTPWEVEDAGDGWLYVADAALGVVPVDIRDPEGVVIGAPLVLPGNPYDLVVERNRIYVAMGAEGVAILDRADPAAPTLLSTISTGGTAVQVSATGGWVAVADRIGVAVVDARDAAHPAPFTRVDTDQYGMAVLLQGDTLYVGDWEWFETWRLDVDRPAPVADLVATSVSRADGLAHFTVTNRGAADLRFFGATASDGVSSVSVAARRLAPGATTEIQVAGGQGVVDVCVATDDPRTPSLALQVTDGPGPPVGIVAPDFTLTDTEGVTHTLSEALGRPVFIGFFATW